jgi:hypothetical protein
MNTSQNGTNSDSSGSWRPVMAPILKASMPVTWPATMIGNPQGAERHRRGIGDQAQAGGIQRVEAQAHQQRGGDCHWSAETGCPFEEGAEAEADQQHLQALVVGD